MKIQFNLKVHTQFGQNIYLLGNSKELGNNQKNNAIALDYVGKDHWACELEIKQDQIEYQYLIQENQKFTPEWQSRTIRTTNVEQELVILQDFWTDSWLPENNFSTHFFKNLTHFKKDRALTQKGKNVVFKIKANLFNPDYKLCLLGGCKELKNWDTKKPILLKQTAFNEWELPIKFKKTYNKIAYKYGVYNGKTKEFVNFEQGGDRYFYPQNIDVFRIVNDNNFINRTNNNWRGSGVAVPVFSLRTKNSLGIGEFQDLKTLADWCQLAGIKMIQILPINDTTATKTWTDSYPYAGISVYALHPQFLNIEQINLPKPKGFKTKYNKLKKELNQEIVVEYERVNQEKIRLLREIFDLNSTKIRRSTIFKAFQEEQKDWLKPYATFSVLRDKYNTADFTQWKKDKKFTKKLVDKTFAKNAKTQRNALFYCFLQWQLHEQLLDAANYIHNKKITLKGDIPIGIYRNSADAWISEKLYHRDQQAGAPPDDFSELGQNWGFPTYNWSEMQNNNFQWWKSRFNHMAQYFDAFRIDHILGFFRIWQIPEQSTQGILGYFHPAIAYTVQELHEKHLWYDHDRLLKPYINQHILWEFFGDQKDEIFKEYMQESHGNIRFKAAYNTQRKVEEKIKDNNWLKNALLALHANVLFINEGTEQQPKLHPRFALYQTKSYQHLDDDTKRKLKELHDDYFYHRNEQFWKEKALEKLPDLKQSTNMLVCGEDLGMVPKVVPEVMNQLSMLALKIQRMPSGNERFSHPNNAPYLSVVSPSSHDTSTLRQWWEESHNNSQFFYNHMIGKDGGAPKQMNLEIMHAIVDQHLWSPAMLCVIPIQEFFALNPETTNPDIHAERINKPDIFPHYWQYRMHIPLEELIKKEDFNAMLKDKMQRSGRL